MNLKFLMNLYNLGLVIDLSDNSSRINKTNFLGFMVFRIKRTFNYEILMRGLAQSIARLFRIKFIVRYESYSTIIRSLVVRNILGLNLSKSDINYII